MPKIRTRESIRKLGQSVRRTSDTAQKMKSIYQRGRKTLQSATEHEAQTPEEDAASRMDKAQGELTADVGAVGAWTAEQTTGAMKQAFFHIHKGRREPNIQTRQTKAQTMEFGRSRSPQRGEEAVWTPELSASHVQGNSPASPCIPPKKRTVQEIRKAPVCSVSPRQKRVGKGRGDLERPAIKLQSHEPKTVGKVGQHGAETAIQGRKLAEASVQEAMKQVGTGKKAVFSTIRKSTDAVVQAGRRMLAAAKNLWTALATGGAVAVSLVLLVCVIGLLGATDYGIFFSGASSGETMAMGGAIQELNRDYQREMDRLQREIPHDILKRSGNQARWPEVLSVYAVKLVHDSENPREAVTMTEEKKEILRDIFWDMNEIAHSTETQVETVVEQQEDAQGNPVEVERTQTTVVLHMMERPKSAEDMAIAYGFSQEQMEIMQELLHEKNKALWAEVLYGGYGGDERLAEVAQSQIGNVGGTPYWSWYGFSTHVEWCACFVSWCANECGYIEEGKVPKYAGCVWGVNWFREQGKWADGAMEPAPGMIIFFDWDDKGLSGPQDGLSDHTGIVVRAADGLVYTVEGNSGNQVRERSYPVGYYEILGYGLPQN